MFAMIVVVIIAALTLLGTTVALGAGVLYLQKKEVGKTEVKVTDTVLNAENKIVTDDEAAVENLLNKVHTQLPLDKPEPKTAKELLSVDGFEFAGAEGTALIRPVGKHAASPVTARAKPRAEIVPSEGRRLPPLPEKKGGRNRPPKALREQPKPEPKPEPKPTLKPEPKTTTRHRPGDIVLTPSGPARLLRGFRPGDEEHISTLGRPRPKARPKKKINW